MNTDTFIKQNKINTGNLPPELRAAVLNLTSIEFQYDAMPVGEGRQMVGELLLKSDDAMLLQLQQWHDENKPPPHIPRPGSKMNPKYYYIKMPFIHLGNGNAVDKSIAHHLNKLFVIRGYPVKFNRKHKDQYGKSLTALNDMFFVAKIDDVFFEQNNIWKDAFFNTSESIDECYNRWVIASTNTGELWEYPRVKWERKHHNTKKTTLLKFETILDVNETIERYKNDITDQAISFVKMFRSKNIQNEIRKTPPEEDLSIGYLPMYFSLITPEVKYIRKKRIRKGAPSI